MIRIDPHTHSSYSDGTDQPRELMLTAARLGLDVLGLTDHDTVEGWDEAVSMVPATGVALMRGIELSTSLDGISAHVLAYMPDPHNDSLVNVMAQMVDSRVIRAKRMVDALAVDYPVSWESVMEQVREPNAPVGRPHMADALVTVGAFPDRSTAFREVLRPDSPYYVHQWAPDPVEVVKVIRDAGGVPVLAHPRARSRQRVLSEDVIEAMAEAGLFALERDHRDHSPQERDEVERIARRLRLQMTGSSDYHGTGKPNVLGENLTSEYVYRSIEEQSYLEVVRP